MKRVGPLELIRRVPEIFLSEPIDKTFLCMESADHPDNYQFWALEDCAASSRQVEGSEPEATDNRRLSIANRCSQLIGRV
jgi:hypothetical protein